MDRHSDLEGLLKYFMEKIETIETTIPLIKLCHQPQIETDDPNTQKFRLPVGNMGGLIHNSEISESIDGFNDIDLKALAQNVSDMEELVDKINSKIRDQEMKLMNQQARIDKNCDVLAERVSQISIMKKRQNTERISPQSSQEVKTPPKPCLTNGQSVRKAQNGHSVYRYLAARSVKKPDHMWSTDIKPRFDTTFTPKTSKVKGMQTPKQPSLTTTTTTALKSARKPNLYTTQSNICRSSIRAPVTQQRSISNLSCTSSKTTTSLSRTTNYKFTQSKYRADGSLIKKPTSTSNLGSMAQQASNRASRLETEAYIISR